MLKMCWASLWFTLCICPVVGGKARQRVPASGWPIREQGKSFVIWWEVLSRALVPSVQCPSPHLFSSNETSGSPNVVVWLGRRWMLSLSGQRAHRRANKGQICCFTLLGRRQLTSPILLPYCFNLPCKYLIKDVVAKQITVHLWIYRVRVG